MRLIVVVFALLPACASVSSPAPETGEVVPPTVVSVPPAASAEVPSAETAEEPEDVLEATSLLGRPLIRPRFIPVVTERREKQLADARLEVEQNPGSADALIWLGRRLAYLARYREAIEVFTEGTGRFPQDARFLRHRGHRYITLRQFERAVADLEKAATLVHGRPDEIEPDGLPNARNIPVSSLQSNICYHLGLAHYLKGDFERALPVYQRCAIEATNTDRLVSVSHWLYMTLRRLGRPQEAEHVLEAVMPGMDVIENVAYHKLLLMYRGEIEAEELLGEPADGNDEPTILYGVGNWHLYNGKVSPARETFRRILTGENWPAFGFIAAEAELARE